MLCHFDDYTLKHDCQIINFIVSFVIRPTININININDVVAVVVGNSDCVDLICASVDCDPDTEHNT